MKTAEDALARAARAEAALADDDAADRCAAAEARAARAEADAAERAARADRAEAALAASRGAAADAAQAAAALADDAAGFTQRVSKIVDGARDACADGLVEGALSAARLSLAREETDAVKDAEAEQRRHAEALSAARAEAELRRQSSEQHKDEAKELRQTVRDLKGTIGTQRAYIRANDDADDLRLQLRKLQRALDVAEAKASKADSLEVRLHDLQNELEAHKAQGEVFSVDATRLSVVPPVPPPLPPRPTQTLADGAVVPAATVAPTAPPIASDFDAELLRACRKHNCTGKWRVVARRLKLWRIVQTAHELREHCDAPTPVASPVASPARTEELEPAAEPSPASTEEEPSPTKTEPSSQPLSLSAWASAAPSLPKTPPADRDGALNSLNAWASRRSPEPAASASPELALGAFSSRKSLESPPRSPARTTSPLAAFMAKVPNPTSPALSPRSQQKSPSKLAAFVAAVPNPQSPRAPSPPLSSRLRSSAGANRKRSKTPGSRKTPIKTRENSPPPRRSPRRSPRFQRSG